MADRFTSDDFLFRSGLTYSPETFEQSLFLPLQYRDREDRLANEMSDVITKMSNINVGDNEKAREYYNQFVNKTNEEISNIQKGIMDKGVLNPNTINNFRNLKTRYNIETSATGGIGQLSRLATEVQQQRGLRLERNLTEGYGADVGLTNYKNQVDQMYNGINWDRFANDPTYSIGDFQATYAPKNTTVEDIVKDQSSTLGSLTSSYKGNTLNPIIDPATGLWTLTNTNDGRMTSTNEPQLQALNQSIRMEIEDLNSPLMQAELYRRGFTQDSSGQYNVSDEELQDIRERLSQKLTYSILAMTTRIDSVDNMQSQQVINTMGGSPSIGSGSGSGDSSNDDSTQAKLETGEAGYRNIDENPYTKNLADVVNGKAYSKLQEMGNSGNYKGMDENTFAKVTNDVIALEKTMFKELNDINKKPEVRKDVYNKAYNKKLTRFGDGMLTDKYRSKFNDSEFSNNSMLNANIKSMSSYKLPNTDFTVKEIFNDVSKYNQFIKNRDQFISNFDKYKPLESQLLSKTPYKNEIGMFYDNSNIKGSLLAVNDKGQFIYGTSQSDLYDKISNTEKFGKYTISTGENGVINALAKLNNVDSNTMKEYLKASTNKNLYQNFDGAIKASVIEQNNERLNKDGLKYNSETIYLGQGEASLKLGERVNKVINTNTGTNLYNMAINSNSIIMMDGDYKEVNELFSSETGIADMINTFQDAKFSFQNIVTNTGDSSAEIGYKIEYKKGNENKTAFLYIPYTGDSKSTGTESLLKELQDNLGPYDSARIKSIVDNTKTKYLVVDSTRTVESGASKHQKELLTRAGKDILPHTILNNTNYTKETAFFRNADKANLYVDNDGFYGLTTQNGSNSPSRMSVKQYVRKESSINAINNKTMGTAGYLDSSENYDTPAKQEMLIKEVHDIVQMTRQGIIKIPTVDPENYQPFNDFMQLMETPMGGLSISSQQKYLYAKQVYDGIKDKQILHKNKLKLLY